jgi:NDP-sugar pyrophosphorylase family protein
MDFITAMRAMVLCAGYGTRLGDLTREIPKPMLPLPEHPLLAYLLAHLRAHGFGEIAINLHFLPETIPGYFGDGAKMNVALTYVKEERLLGTAGGVKNMENFLRASDPFLVQYGDVVTDQDFTAMLRFHQARGALATLLLHQRIRSNSVVSLDGEGRIVGFLERPSAEERRGVESSWVNSGICLCRPEIFGHIPVGTTCDLPRDIFPKLIGTGQLFGFPLSGYRCAIDSPERLAEARAAMTEGRCRISLASI